MLVAQALWVKGAVGTMGGVKAMYSTCHLKGEIEGHVAVDWRVVVDAGVEEGPQKLGTLENKGRW